MKDKKAKPKSIDVDKIDLDLLKKHTTDLPGLLEYAHSVGGFAIAPTEKGAIKATAFKAMEQQTNMQLDMVYEQMKVLAKQVQEIKTRVEVSSLIYQADMNFEPVIGQFYYLYEKGEHSYILSMISPEEWGHKVPGVFQSKVQLLADRTWKVY